MILNRVQSRQLSGGLKDSLVAFELKDGMMAARKDDKVIISDSYGAVVHESHGQSLDTSSTGDVLWMDGDTIMRWDEESGATQLAKGYNGMVPGPEGKVFALRPGSREQNPAVVLLDQTGEELGSKKIPTDARVTGAYVSFDDSTLLVGLTEDVPFDPRHADRETRDIHTVERFTVEGDSLKSKRLSRHSVGYQDEDDNAPILLNDGRVMTFEGSSVKVGKAVPKGSRQMLAELGGSAAPAGHRVDFFYDLKPAVTLAEQMEQASKGIRSGVLGQNSGSNVGPTPVWVQPNTAEMTPVDRGAGAKRLTFGKALKSLFGKEKAGSPSALSADPKVQQELQSQMLLEGTSPKEYQNAQVFSQGNRTLVSFANTGMLLTAVSGDEEAELHLYGPTGDEKQLKPASSFSLDQESGRMTIDDTVYDLETGDISATWATVKNGLITRADLGDAHKTVTYWGNGVFTHPAGEFQAGVHKSMPIPPEVFHQRVAVGKPEGVGETLQRKTVLAEQTPGFQELTRIETLKKPNLKAAEIVGELQGERQDMSYRLVLADGRVLEGNSEGATLNGKDIDAGLTYEHGNIVLNSVVDETYREPVKKKPWDSFLYAEWGQTAPPAPQNIKFEAHQITQRFLPSGDIEVTRTAHEKRDPKSPKDVVDSFIIRSDGSITNFPIARSTKAGQVTIDKKGRVDTGVTGYTHSMTSPGFRLPVPPSQ